MKIYIVYDTRRKRSATRQLAEWMKEYLEEKGYIVEIKKPYEIRDFNYDLFIIGSPIYYEKPMKSIINFLSKNKDSLKDKRIAIFVVCIAEIFGKYTMKYINDKYLKPLVMELLAKPITTCIFRGWLYRVDLKQKDACIRCIENILSSISNM